MAGIGRTGSKKTSSTGTIKSDNNTASVTSTPVHALKEDKLEVSAEAQHIDELFQSLADVKEVDQVRVDSIRRAIKNGELQVDYPLLAATIMELMDEFNRDE